jgi:hypothetical protein
VIALILLALLWALCGVLAYGINVAYFWHSYPILQTKPGHFRTLSGEAALICGLFGPIALLAEFFSSGFAMHGLMYRQPTPKGSR